MTQQRELEQARMRELLGENKRLQAELMVAAAIIEALVQGLSPEVVFNELKKRGFRPFEWLRQEVEP
jgi:hypothetical protein